MLRKLFASLFILSSLAIAAPMLLPAKAFAADPVPKRCDVSSQERKVEQGIDLGYCAILESLPKSSIKDVWGAITAAVDFIAKGVGVLALFGLIVTGIMYITAGGDPDKAAKAQKNIGWIVTGLVIFMLLFWFPKVISELVRDIPNSELAVDTKGTKLAQKDLKIERWPNELDATNLIELLDKRALAVANRASITISNGALTPSTLTVQEGALVIWYNNDTVSHRYVKDPKKQSTMGPVQINVPARAYYLQFVEGPGEFNFTEDIPGPVSVAGTITSTENTQLTTPDCASALSTQINNTNLTLSISLAGISSQGLDVNPLIYNGTEIIWTNTDTKIHTITRDRRSTMIGGPKPTILQPGESLKYKFTGEPNTQVQFTYFDETDPGVLYGICTMPR